MKLNPKLTLKLTNIKTKTSEGRIEKQRRKYEGKKTQPYATDFVLIFRFWFFFYLEDLMMD
jgi:hypothetical protein